MAISAKIKNTIVHVGDTVTIHQEIVEDEKKRTQIFQGVVIAIKGSESGKSFTVRKISAGNIGVERIWPIISPSIKKVEIKKHGSVRRSKLYYLRQRTGKRAVKIKTREIKAADKKEVVAEQSAPKKKLKKPSKSGAKATTRKKG